MKDLILGFFHNILLLVSLAKMVTLTNNQKFAQYRKYICTGPKSIESKTARKCSLTCKTIQKSFKQDILECLSKLKKYYFETNHYNFYTYQTMSLNILSQATQNDINSKHVWTCHEFPS